MLDNGDSKLHVAQTLGISESAIRYHMRKGNILKKK
jgi:DNA-binding NarL/FixJ family response regulator